MTKSGSLPSFLIDDYFSKFNRILLATQNNSSKERRFVNSKGALLNARMNTVAEMSIARHHLLLFSSRQIQVRKGEYYIERLPWGNQLRRLFFKLSLAFSYQTPSQEVTNKEEVVGNSRNPAGIEIGILSCLFHCNGFFQI